MDKFIYLKLGRGNCLAEYWLSEDNVSTKPVAAIYFGTITTEKIEELIKKPKKEAEDEFKRLVSGKNPDFNAAKDFVEAGKKLGEKTFITITHNKVYIFEPSGEVKDMPEDEWREYDKALDVLSQASTAGTKKNIEEMKIEITSCIIDRELEADLNKNVISERLKREFKANKFAPSEGAIIEKGDKDNEWVIKSDKEKKKIYIARKEDEKLKIYRHIPKIMPVRFLKDPFPIADVPHVLASLPCNQHLTRGTFREIKSDKNWGAVQAIKYCLNEQIGKHEKASELMNFLSSYELETLVFLILTNADLFVPAWRGGTQKGFDLIAHNFTNSTIKKLQIPVESEDGSKSSFTFQVKKGNVEKPSEFANFTIATEYDKKDNRILNAEWLLENIRKDSKTRKWFIELLYWIPEIDSLIDKIKC